jgi:hypothetical protein
MFLSAVVGGGVAATSALLAVRKAALQRTAKKSEDELEAWERLGLGEKCRPLFLVDFHSGYTHLNHGCVSTVTAWRALAACLRVCPSSCLPCELPCVVPLVGTATPAGVLCSAVLRVMDRVATLLWWLPAPCHPTPPTSVFAWWQVCAASARVSFSALLRGGCLTSARVWGCVVLRQVVRHRAALRVRPPRGGAALC